MANNVKTPPVEPERAKKAGEYLRGLRKNAGLTVVDLSKHSGVSRSIINIHELGHITTTKISPFIFKLCEFYDFRLSHEGRAVDEYARLLRVPRSSIHRFIKTYGDDTGCTIRPARFATDYPPGSPQKLAIITERVARGQSPFHPDDNVCLDERSSGESESGKAVDCARVAMKF